MDIRVGDSFSIGPFTARLTDGTVVPLTDCSIEASVSTGRGATPLFTLQNTTAGGNNSQILVTDATGGEFYAYVSTTQSANMVAGTTYYLDARVKTAGGAVYTVGEAKWKALAAFTPVPTP